MSAGASSQRRQAGLSLIELMLSLAIGSVLSLGVTLLFLHSKVSAWQDAQMARVQENGRYAMRYLERELNMAGYLGSALWGGRLDAGPAGTGCFDHLLDADNALEHYDNVGVDGRPTSGGEPLPADCLLSAGGYVAQSDILLVRRTLDNPAVSQGVRATALDPDTLYLRVDVSRGAAGFEPGGGSLAPSIDVLEYSPQILFLRDYSISPGDGIPVLCRQRLAPRGNRMAPVECLVEGIEDLQLEFGIDDDGDRRADRYRARPSPSEIRRAVAARIFLLLRSIRPVPGFQQGQSHTLGGKVITPANDGHYRRVLVSTVVLRNATGVKS